MSCAAPTTEPPQAGTITVADQTVAVTQGDGCAFNIAPNDVTLGAGGGTGEVNVTTDAGCGWSAASNASWISIISGASGMGSGPVRFSVAPIAGPAHSGTLTVARHSVTVVQQSECTLTIDPMTRTFEAAGGAGTVHVTSPAGCEWRATSNVAWITIRGGATGAGVGDVSFDVGANSGPQRSGTLTIGSLTFTVDQSSGCSYGVTPAGISVPAAGGSDTITVTTSAQCTWTASTTTAWLSITSGSGGTGSGAVQFTAVANAGPARSGAIAVAGSTVTIDQSSGCAFAVAPASQAFEARGGPGTIAVTAGTGCTWTATSAVAWITITSGASGSGSGSVTFAVAENTEATARSGTITAAGQTFTVMQAASAELWRSGQ